MAAVGRGQQNASSKFCSLATTKCEQTKCLDQTTDDTYRHKAKILNYKPIVQKRLKMNASSFARAEPRLWPDRSLSTIANELSARKQIDETRRNADAQGKNKRAKALANLQREAERRLTCFSALSCSTCRRNSAFLSVSRSTFWSRASDSSAIVSCCAITAW